MAVGCAFDCACLARQPAVAPPAGSSEPAGAKLPSASGFVVRFDKAVSDKAFSGRVYVFATKRSGGEPRLSASNWFMPPMILSRDVKGVGAGGTVEFSLEPGAAMTAFPTAFGEWEKRAYQVQAVARLSTTAPVPGAGEGDLYSEPLQVEFTGNADGVGGAGGKPVELVLSKVVAAKEFRETSRIKYFEMKSDKLSAFHGKPYTVKAGVVLPEAFDDPANKDRQWPTLYVVTGFGGDHHSVRGYAGANYKDMLVVMPDATNYYGHSVFADSAVIGPWGSALVDEIVPAVEAKYRGAGDGSRRFVTGVSSGGWSSLWLVVTYPESFAACYSHVPDPVDFRDFQQIDLYGGSAGTPMNMFKDDKGERRPIARQGSRPMLYYDKFVAMETALGAGGQIESFEAVFSPKNAAGTPRALFDRATGNIDPETAKAWEAYDIRLMIERNWATLGPRLKGKLHVYAGEIDNFYLEGATRLLKESLSKLGSDAVVEIVPGMGHKEAPEGRKAMLEAIAKVK